MRLAIQLALQKDTILTSLKVSIVVGLILTFINQEDIIISFQFKDLDPVKAILTFVIPFLVSTYSSVKAKIDFRIGDISSATVMVECENCGLSHILLQKDKTVPICPKCMENTHWNVTSVE